MRTVSKDRQLRGIVLREAAFGEADKYITVLTGELGKISVVAKGARSLRSSYMQATQTFCCADFTVSERRERYTLVEANVVDSFFALRNDFSSLALGQYFLEVVGEVCSENDPRSAENVLRLLLNSLYALTNDLRPRAQIKAAFEFRLAAIEGFMPELGCCAECGIEKNASQMFLDVMNGSLICTDCKMKSDDAVGGHDIDEPRTASIICPMTPETLGALRYMITSRPERLLAFSMTDEGLSDVEKIAEVYLLNHLERGFETLKFYRQTELLERRRIEALGRTEQNTPEIDAGNGIQQ